MKDLTMEDGSVNDRKLWLLMWKAADLIYPGVNLDGVLSGEKGEAEVKGGVESSSGSQGKSESDYVIVTKDEG